MRILGYFLVLAGFIMLIARGIQYTKKEKLVDAGPVEISVKEKKMLTWPYYAGALAVVAGFILIVMDKKRS